LLELRGHSGPVLGLAYSPNGKLLASASADGTARVWDARSGRLLEAVSSSEPRAYCVAFSPDGKQLGVGYGNERGLVQLWRLDPLRKTESWAAHSRMTRGLAFRPNLSVLLTCGSSPQVCAWRLPNLVREQERSIDGLDAVGIDFWRESPHFATLDVSPPKLHFWEFRGNVILNRRSVDLPGSPAGWGYALSYSSADQQVACGLENSIIVVAAERRAPKRSPWAAHDGAVLGVAFLPDGQSLLSAATDGLVKQWSLEGRLLNTMDWQIGELGAVAIAPDGLTAAVGGAEKIVVWDLEV
jgi:WD40 repeat protein